MVLDSDLSHIYSNSPGVVHPIENIINISN